MRHKGDRSVLTSEKIAWAWTKICEGHTVGQVAEALHVDRSTLTRTCIRIYGKTKPEADEMIPLVYEATKPS